MTMEEVRALFLGGPKGKSRFPNAPKQGGYLPKTMIAIPEKEIRHTRGPNYPQLSGLYSSFEGKSQNGKLLRPHLCYVFEDSGSRRVPKAIPATSRCGLWKKESASMEYR